MYYLAKNKANQFNIDLVQNCFFIFLLNNFKIILKIKW